MRGSNGRMKVRSKQSLIGPLVVYCALFLINGSDQASQTELAKGQIVDRVLCASDAAQSYALYLPSSYSPERRWPILYALDPGARGKLPVERYKDAAEKYGWIVAGLNNSRNGSMQESGDALAAVWDATHQRFAIDGKRVYLTGFSGGARAATFLAYHCSDCGFAGVIGSGAGFPADLAPSSAIHFAYFGTVGLEDFNFPEVKNLDEALTRANIVHQVGVFAGRHDWPPSAMAMEAIEFLELDAMKANRRPRDNSLVDQIWQQRLQQAKALEESKKIFEAYQIYVGLGVVFKGLRDVSEADTLANQLRASRDVKEALRDEREQIRKQQELEARIWRLIAGRGNSADASAGGDGLQSSGVDSRASTRTPNDAGGKLPETENGPDTAAFRLRAVIADLQKTAKASQDTSDRRIARRVTEGLLVGLFEQGMNLLETQKRYAAAAKRFELATEVAPERPGVFFYLASALALSGEKKKSIRALQSAVDKGFSDLAAITDNKAFDSIRNEREYLQIIERLKTRN
jgi:dienelactone hydrolase